MTLQQLHALIAVKENGSIRGAARMLFQTQAAITKTIKNLEEDIGFPLIVRESRGVTFTQDGEILLNQARQAIRSLEVARETIQQRHDADTGTIRMAVTPMIALTILNEAIAWFRSRYQNIHLQIYDGSLMHCLPQLRRREIDFALIATLPSGGTLSTQEFHLDVIGETGVCLGVRQGHPLLARATKEKIDIETLLQWEWIITGRSRHEARMSLKAILNGAVPKHVTLCDPQSVTSLVAGSDGITVIPRAIVHSRFGLGLTELSSDVSVPNHHLEFIRSPDAPLTPAMEYMMHCLSDKSRELIAEESKVRR